MAGCIATGKVDRILDLPFPRDFPLLFVRPLDVRISLADCVCVRVCLVRREWSVRVMSPVVRVLVGEWFSAVVLLMSNSTGPGGKLRRVC